MFTAFETSRGAHSNYKGSSEGTHRNNRQRIVNSKKASLVKDFMSTHNQTLNNWSPRDMNTDDESKEQMIDSESTMRRSMFKNKDINLFLNMRVQSPLRSGKEVNTPSSMRYHSVLKPREENKIFERVLSAKRLSESIQGKSIEYQK